MPEISKKFKVPGLYFSFIHTRSSVIGFSVFALSVEGMCLPFLLFLIEGSRLQSKQKLITHQGRTFEITKLSSRCAPSYVDA